MNRSMPGLPVHHQLLEFTQTHAHRVSDAIQPYHTLSSPSPPAPNPSQHQGVFQWVNSLHEVAKVLEFQLQHFNWKITTFQYCNCFCHTSAWISHRGTCVPPSWTHLPTPLSCSRAPALSALLHAKNLQWSPILYTVIYMFQCDSLKSSHPCLLSQSPKVCVSFAALHIGSLLPSF